MTVRMSAVSLRDRIVACERCARLLEHCREAFSGGGAGAVGDAVAKNKDDRPLGEHRGRALAASQAEEEGKQQYRKKPGHRRYPLSEFVVA